MSNGARQRLATAEQVELWRRWQAGESVNAIARALSRWPSECIWCRVADSRVSF